MTPSVRLELTGCPLHSRFRSCLSLLAGLVLLAFNFVAADESGGTISLPAMPRVNCAVYVMEYHVWYRSPFGGRQPGFVHWGDPEHIDFPSPQDQNVRDLGAQGYPLLGLYDSENEDVIRWQLRCIHNTGIDAIFVDLFPDRNMGTTLGGTAIFATILRLAEEEHVKVAVHDEVMFRAGWKAQQPDVMAARISGFIHRFGSDPAYLKIDGHPAYAFQYWNKFIPASDMANCLDQSEHLAGTPIHFFVLGGADQLYQRSSPSSFVVGSNSSFIKSDTLPVPPSVKDWLMLSLKSYRDLEPRTSYPADRFGLWAYPGFDNRPQRQMLGDSHFRAFSRQDGHVLSDTLTAYNRLHPDFIMLSSWNDWMENTAFEPGYRFASSDKANQVDPYRYCRLLAKLKGINFQPPPLPPVDAIDPLRKLSLYGVDASAPLLKTVNPTENKSRVSAVWADAGSMVTNSVLAEAGEAWIDFLGGSAMGFLWKAEPERVLSKSGYLLTEKGPLDLQLESVTAQGKLSDWYVVLQFQEQGPGVITVSYPAKPAAIDYLDYDGLTFPFVATIRTGAQGLLRTEIALLHAANFTAANALLTVRFSPAKSEGRPDAAVLFQRIDLFHSLADATEGICSSGPPASNSDTCFQYNLVGKPKTVFLFARDAKDNWTPPQVVPLPNN